MFNREYQVRAKRRGKLEGEQLDITFPRRGRPSRIRRLERAGQMRLGLTAGREWTKSEHAAKSSPPADPDHQLSIEEVYDPDFSALLHGRPLTEDELAAEFHRLFPPEES